MDATIRLSDLGLIILWLAILVLIFYVVMTLKRVLETLKEVQKIINDNRENIDKTLQELPSISKNIEELTSEFSKDIKSVKGTIDNFKQKSELASILEGSGDVISGVTSILHGVIFIKKFFDKFLDRKKA